MEIYYRYHSLYQVSQNFIILILFSAVAYMTQFVGPCFMKSPLETLHITAPLSITLIAGFLSTYLPSYDSQRAVLAIFFNMNISSSIFHLMMVNMAGTKHSLK